MKNVLTIIILCSFIFPLSFSRIVTTFDFPGEYTVSLSDFNSGGENEFVYATKQGINVAYEHIVTSGEIVGGTDIYVFAGGEFMVGRRSDVNVSFHSVYIKPVVAISDNLLLSFSAGLAKLNTEQNDFILDMGSLISMGLEYQITENMSLLLSGSAFNLFEDTYSATDGFTQTPLMNIDLEGLDETDIDMQYIKTGLSIIYGFNVNK